MRALLDSVPNGLALLGIGIVLLLGIVTYVVLDGLTPGDLRPGGFAMPTPSMTLGSPPPGLPRPLSMTPSPATSVQTPAARSSTPEPPAPAVTQTPVRTETPSGTPTATPSAPPSSTPLPSATATRTALPTLAWTVRPAASATTTPAVTPTFLPAPVLWIPADGAEFDREEQIALAWAPAGALAPDAFYVVTLTYHHAGQTWIDDVPWLKQANWVLSDHAYLYDLSEDGVFEWSVQVMRVTGADPITGKPMGVALSSSSKVHTLYWKANTSGTPAPPQPAGVWAVH